MHECRRNEGKVLYWTNVGTMNIFCLWKYALQNLTAELYNAQILWYMFGLIFFLELLLLNLFSGDNSGMSVSDRCVQAEAAITSQKCIFFQWNI